MKFDNGARITAHKNALEHAYVKINGVRDTSLSRWQGSRILARSTNTTAHDWYGHFDNLTNGSNGGIILINQRTTEKDNFSTNNYRKLALHELGHAFGMKHQNRGVDSLMKQGKMTYTDYTTLDKNNLNWRY